MNEQDKPAGDPPVLLRTPTKFNDDDIAYLFREQMAMTKFMQRALYAVYNYIDNESIGEELRAAQREYVNTSNALKDRMGEVGACVSSDPDGEVIVPGMPEHKKLAARILRQHKKVDKHNTGVDLDDAARETVQ